MLLLSDCLSEDSVCVGQTGFPLQLVKVLFSVYSLSCPQNE